MALIKETLDYERGGTQKDEYTVDEVVVVPCPLCGSQRRTRIYTEHGAVGVSRCRSCSLIYTCPRIESPESIYWGDADKYYAEARLVFQGKRPHHRDPNYREELALIRRYKPTGRFLDVGCNMGMLLRHVREWGWTAVGVEPSPSLSRLATEHLGLDVYNCFLHELPASEEGSFDVVALSDILEHITDPRGLFRQIDRFLAPGGILYVKVPNARWSLFKQDVLARMGRQPKQGLWDAYEHVVHYTDETLRRLLDQAGFEPLRVTVGRPVQIPVWHNYVGHYYQYPSPWVLDWKRHLGRAACYWLSRPQRALRGGSIGNLAPDIAAVAQRRSREA